MTPNSSTINFDPAIPTDWEKSTYYVRDAQGNVMAIYEYTIDDVTQDNHYTLTERNIYGSSRLGNNNAPVEMIATTPPNPSQYSHHIGYRQYELSNHLGNVLAVISDRKIARDTDQDNTVDYYEPDVLLTYDYSPFGAPLHARSFTKEVCDEVTSTQKIEDLNTDFTYGTAQGWTAMGNTSLTVNTSGQLKIEKNGGGQLMGATQSFMAISGELYDFTITIDKGSCNTNADILLEVLDINNTVIYTQTLSSGTQTYTTQFTASASGAYVITVQRINNAANCYFLIDDVLITHEEEVTQTLCEDFAGYRYGFNGQEKDDEIKGAGNSYSFTFRMYDPRLGKFFIPDPLESEFPFISPYLFSENSPIAYVDIDGLEKISYTFTLNIQATFEEKLPTWIPGSDWVNRGAKLPGSGTVSDVQVEQSNELLYRIVLKVPSRYSISGEDVKVVWYDTYVFESNNLDGVDNPENWKLQADYMRSFAEGVNSGLLVGLGDAVISKILGSALGKLSGIAQIARTNTKLASALLKADDLVRSVGTAIENTIPNSIKNVERIVRGSNNKILTDFDLELDRFVIEVTKGSGKGKANQILNKIAPNAQGKEVILFGPKLSKSVINSLSEKGIKTFTKKKDLVKFIKENKE